MATMCRIMEDMRNEAALESARKTARETAERLIRKGKMTLDELRELEAEIMQLA